MILAASLGWPQLSIPMFLYDRIDSSFGNLLTVPEFIVSNIVDRILLVLCLDFFATDFDLE